MEELLSLLEKHGPAAKLLAGGTDLLVRLRWGHAAPEIVIDLKRVPELRADIAEIAGGLRVGARTVMTDLIGDARVRRHFPALVEAAGVVGSVQIRNRATLAGNICNASPAADTAPALLVYDAVANVRGLGGKRRVPLGEFFTGPGRTVLERGEVIESIDLPVPEGPRGAAFGRVTRRRGVDLATINLCCLVKPSGETRFAYGAVGPRPFLVEDTSGMLADPTTGAAQRDARLRELIAHASPISDLRGGRDYRMAMLLVMSRRTLAVALERLSARAESQSGTQEPVPQHVDQRAVIMAARLSSRGPMRIPIKLRVNGQAHAVEVFAHHSLLEVLRDQLNLTGSKECCQEGECGACTVLLNGRAVNSCLVLAVEADGEDLVTIEGLAAGGRLDPLQSAFLETGAVQCGFCIPGMIMAAKGLLEANPHPTEAEIKAGLVGNLCRCGGYSRIVKAVEAAARQAEE
jgi:xanthine dehydrogenase iron-sulfur cluster and FAD-binding subunit A